MPAPKLSNALRARVTALRAWGATQSGRAYRGAKTAGAKIGAWPWKRIGIWAGGAFGVLATALVLFLAFADWNALRGPIGRWASVATGREIVIAGDLDVDPWSFTPEARVRNLRIGNLPRFRERGQFAEVAEAEVAVRLLPLFVGRFDIVRLDLNGADLDLYRNAAGDANWAQTRRQGQRPLDLPDIRDFSLREGHVRYEDVKRRLVLDAEFTTRESADARNPGEFALDGEGEINNRPFTVEFTGAPLLNVRRNRPYPFVADVRAGGTRIQADGSIARPFNLNRWQADIIASGPDLAHLYDLIGLTLPNTPPYFVRGRVERNGRQYGMPELNGRVGDSDLRGAFTATTNARTGRLFFDGDFVSSRLDFDDLMAVLGGAPATGGGETASATQRAIAANMAAEGRLLPDAELDISRVRDMDARVTYRAARVRSDRFPLRGFSLDISLDQGLLQLDPMTLDLRQGRIGGAVAINAREATPQVNMDVRLTGARLESIVAFRGGAPLTGSLVGRVRLSARGASVREAASNANGEVTLVTPRGEVREAFAELTGINVTRGLGLLLSDDQSKIDIRCGVASFSVRSGVMHARSMVFDTETMLIRGGGRINLNDETLDLRLQGEPKEARLIRVAAPITIQGRLRSPELGVDLEEAADEGGLAALLGSLIAPIAAVLPFVDPGLAEDANCAALLAGREQQTSEG
ncbi:MAG TPA: AsmA family protein [Vitreimonas sp.]|uniref:AsmA family protein n=1 Tax=Vitreimonas sp. TaxID=3069702 RepID=UPI002D5416B0|nr:AsmA family protein [Vitreimonas sp.]HYD86965.1 AsmA family protein [Vitreimonas sp.]